LLNSNYKAFVHFNQNCMQKHNLITSLFICCLSDDLIQYYNPLRFLADNYPKAKPAFLTSQLQSFTKNNEAYINYWNQKLKAEPLESAMAILTELEPLVNSYAAQMELPGFVRSILYKYEQNFGAFK
jgi:hypothetical protein